MMNPWLMAIASILMITSGSGLACDHACSLPGPESQTGLFICQSWHLQAIHKSHKQLWLICCQLPVSETTSRSTCVGLKQGKNRGPVFESKPTTSYVCMPACVVLRYANTVLVEVSGGKLPSTILCEDLYLSFSVPYYVLLLLVNR